MKTKINIAINFIYVAAFCNFFLEIVGIEKSIDSFISLIFDLTIFGIGFSAMKKNKFNAAILLIIFLLTWFNYLSHDYDFTSYLNGLREILLIIVVFAFYEELGSSPYRLLFKVKFQKFAKLFLMAQIPITIMQFIWYGAGDKVGGSLGVGNSGILTLIVIPLVYLRIKEAKRKSGYKAYLNAIYLLPVFLNETKISFLLIPIMFLCLTDYKKRIGTTLASLGFGALVLFSFNSLYTDQGKKGGNPLTDMFNSDFLEFYLLSDVDEGMDVPRFTKIITAFHMLGESTNDLILGKETGAFKGGKVIKLSNFAKHYDWLLMGSRPYIFYLMISGGWTLLLIMVYYVTKKIFSDVRLQNDKQFRFLLLAVFITILFYNDALRNQYFTMIFVYLIYVGKGYFSEKRSKNVHTSHLPSREYLTQAQ